MDKYGIYCQHPRCNGWLEEAPKIPAIFSNKKEANCWLKQHIVSPEYYTTKKLPKKCK